MTSLAKPSRRQVLQAAVAATGALAFPHIANAQAATLRVSGWGGRWSDTLKARVIPGFEKEFNCKVELDTAFPFIPKLQASPKSTPIYDVLHSNNNEQWSAAPEGLVMDRISMRDVPNMRNLHAYAISERTAGVAIFTNAIGLVYRTDKGLPVPKSWKDFANRKYDGLRGSQAVTVNALAQSHLMMLGKVYGKGLTDLDAAYKAYAQLKPLKLVDFAGQLEKMLLAGEVSIAMTHDATVGRNLDAPLAFVAPSEGVIALEQVLNVTTGCKVKELAYAWIETMLRPEVQKTVGEAMWYAPSNKLVQMDAKYSNLLPSTPEKVSKLVQVDWKFYNGRKDEVDSRITRLLKA
jgi:putative spermidine/putrescine transport system substrate-binding protein